MARRLFPKEALRQPFKVSFTSTERQGVEAKAHGAGLTLAAFIRRAALGQKVATKCREVARPRPPRGKSEPTDQDGQQWPTRGSGCHPAHGGGRAGSQSPL